MWVLKTQGFHGEVVNWTEDRRRRTEVVKIKGKTGIENEGL